MSEREEDADADSVEATRSGRHIKRRRFDDEIVESSLGGVSKLGAHGTLQSTPTTPTPVAAIVKMPRPSKESRKNSPPRSLLEVPVATPVKETKVKDLKGKESQSQAARPSKPAQKSSKKRKSEIQLDEILGSTSKPASPFTISSPPFTCLSAPLDDSEDEIDSWKPSDDQLLMQAVIQLKDLELVHKGTKFSYPFSLEQVTSRWKALLYPPGGSSDNSFEGIAELHPSTVEYLERKCPFSEEEEAILSNISSYDDPKMFQSILDAHKEVFHPRRSAKSLLKHWQLMKQYYLLADQHIPASSEKHIYLNFSDVEDEYNDAEMESRCKRRRDFALDNELRQLQRSARKEMKRLESELPLWHAMSADAKDDCRKKVVPDVDNQTLAVLRGRSVRYLMRSKEISLGRSSREIKVDVDFSLEGYAYKISRRQAIIKLRNNGEFVFANEGKRPVYVDGNPVLTGNKLRLNHNSVVELAGLRFVFLVNQKLINSGMANHIQ
ncbi:microspherule protein 1 [Galendromus occidentalis]|uniref:Microspherule protein 1 n=1 Tax=Galendromus occidentalis TaxID=34638 RepID=A0AAJ6QR80_9ACAR|nr:microspherule protein 1 [Galendromus occidentalis]